MAVLGAAHRLKVMDPFAATNPSDDVVLFGLTIGGDDDANRLPDEFRGAVAEHPLRGGVTRSNDPVEIFGDDRVVRRFHDRREVGHLVMRFRLGRCVVVHPEVYRAVTIAS
jgi:hypothetical protein